MEFMSAEAPATPEEVSKFSVLTERDQKLLEESGRNLIEKFLQDYPDKLPDAIIFPDTSARPLVYLFKPILEEVSQQRNVTMPRFYFFAAHRSDSVRLVKKLEGSPYGVPVGKFKRGLAEFAIAGAKKAFGEIEEIRSAWQTRANELKEELEKRGISEPELVIFDEFASIYAVTSSEISRAFGKRVTTYVLTSGWKQEDFNQAGLPVVVGITSKHDLALGAKEGMGYEQVRQERERLIGVRKEREGTALTVSRTPNTDKALMRQLREDMTKIGRKIAEEM